MYLDDLAAAIRAHIPKDCMPEGDTGELFRLYAVLLRAKGASVTQSDVHDAWSAWMAQRDGDHESLVEYEFLTRDVQEQDRIFATAIRDAADQLGQSRLSRPSFMEVLFPSGPPDSDIEMRQTMDLYKVMVTSSESLVSRRQAVNTFFLTINGALLTASGFIVQSSEGSRLVGAGIAALALAGAILCAAWRSLITSFGQLNRGKFQVINTIERYLKVAVYAAEWEALDQGRDPKIYRSFTSREIWVPTALLILHLAAVIVALLVAFGLVVIRT